MPHKIVDDIRDALTNLVTLEIVTAVGAVTFGDDGKVDLAGLGTGTPVPAIVTRIDLLQGDIRTIFGPEFVTGDYQTLREFHAQREQQGYQIIERNIAAIKELLALAQRKELQDAAATNGAATGTNATGANG